METGQKLAVDRALFYPGGQLWSRSGGLPGWAICNGQNGTINLLDKFIRGGAAASISVDPAGSAAADNKPAYCTVIFIEKIV